MARPRDWDRGQEAFNAVMITKNRGRCRCRSKNRQRCRIQSWSKYRAVLAKFCVSSGDGGHSLCRWQWMYPPPPPRCRCLQHPHHCPLHPQARRLGIGLQVHFSSASGSVGGGMGMHLHRRDLSTTLSLWDVGWIGCVMLLLSDLVRVQRKGMTWTLEGEENLPSSGEFIFGSSSCEDSDLIRMMVAEKDEDHKRESQGEYRARGGYRR